MKYFHDCHTAEDVKHQFRENAKKYHPDLGGDPEDFKAMYIEFEKLWSRYKNIHRNAEGETYERETDETPEEFANIINALVQLKGVEVELCGSWIWVSGNTKEYKGQFLMISSRLTEQKSRNPDCEGRRAGIWIKGAFAPSTDLYSGGQLLFFFGFC